MMTGMRGSACTSDAAGAVVLDSGGNGFRGNAARKVHLEVGWIGSEVRTRY